MKRRRAIRIAAIAIPIAVLSILDYSGIVRPIGDDRGRYHDAVATIVYVSDGDTFDIDIPDGNAAKTRVRLWGVDCPEIAHSPDETDAWFGREAADYVQEHFEGRRVRIGLDPNHRPRDKYGRLLAFVFADDSGEMLNEVLLGEGLGFADRRFDHIYRIRFTQMEDRSRRSRQGLWSDPSRDHMPGWRVRMLDAGVIDE